MQQAPAAAVSAAAPSVSFAGSHEAWAAAEAAAERRHKELLASHERLGQAAFAQHREMLSVAERNAANALAMHKELLAILQTQGQQAVAMHKEEMVTHAKESMMSLEAVTAQIKQVPEQVKESVKMHNGQEIAFVGHVMAPGGH